jgi:hypothetical protein
MALAVPRFRCVGYFTEWKKSARSGKFSGNTHFYDDEGRLMLLVSFRAGGFALAPL